jgi:hypothetical protein
MRAIALVVVLMIASAASRAFAQDTRPTTAPSADQILNQMLRPSNTDKSAALQPEASPSAAIASADAGSPDAAAGGAILREGTDVIDRVGRLQKTGDGQEEFVFDSDGRTLGDPPLYILPSLKLMSMETAVSAASHDLRFRVTGTVTEYRGHNYILLEKVVVVQDKNQEF